MLQIILLLLPGVLTLSDEWNVNYPPPICAARGSNVTIACTFKYPSAQVQRVLWCSMRSNYDICQNEPYVYDSDTNNNQRKFQYIGDKISNCCLLISNINQTHSGEYKFRFITSLANGRWTGKPGVEISVHDLRVFMTRSRENGSIIVGDSLNLTCKLNCSGNLAEVQWFKNGELMQHSHPVLTFSSVTAKDSGNYSCSLRNLKTVSEEFRIHIEGITLSSKDVAGSPTVLIIVASLVSLGFITAVVMLIRRRKAKTHGKPKEKGEETQVSHYSTHRTTAETETPTVSTDLKEAENVLQEDEVQYASVNIQPKKLLQKSANTEQENDSSIYSTVMNG